MDISIILPTYNEKENISIIIPKIIHFFEQKKVVFEILVVDDNSPDGTGQAVLDLAQKYKNIRLINRQTKEGIGAALREGYDSALGRYILSSDADLSFEIVDMGRLYDKIREGYDLVVGSRHTLGGHYEKNNIRTSIKNFISCRGNKLFHFLFPVPITDFSVNFRIIKNDTWHLINTTEKTNFLLFEMIFKTSLKQGKITEIPISFKDRIYGQSKLNLSSEAPKALIKAIMIFVKYKLGGNI